MTKCDVWGLAKLLSRIEESRLAARTWIESDERDEIVTPHAIELYVKSLVLMAAHHAEKLQLQSTYDRVWLGGGCFYLISNHLTWQQLASELAVLRQCIEADLEKHWFVRLPLEKVNLLERLGFDWDKIWTAIPEAKVDIMEATECYMLDRNTASVFHSMRVGERGLRRIAKRLRVTITDKGKRVPLEYATWNKVLDQIESKIKTARQKPVGRSRDKQLMHFSEAAQHCRYMKDLWRNEVSHAGKAYNAGEALGVLNRVRDFMSFLVDGTKSS